MFRAESGTEFVNKVMNFFLENEIVPSKLTC